MKATISGVAFSAAKIRSPSFSRSSSSMTTTALPAAMSATARSTESNLVIRCYLALGLGSHEKPTCDIQYEPPGRSGYCHRLLSGTVHQAPANSQADAKQKSGQFAQSHMTLITECETASVTERRRSLC